MKKIDQLVFNTVRLAMKYIVTPGRILRAMIRMRYLEVVHHGDVPAEKILTRDTFSDETIAHSTALAALDRVCERLRINKEKSMARAHMFGFYHNQITDLQEVQRVVTFMKAPNHCKAALEFLIHHKDIKREAIPFVAEGGQKTFDAWLEKDDVDSDETKAMVAAIIKDREEKGLPL
jgi:hypothetical protein